MKLCEILSNPSNQLMRLGEMRSNPTKNKKLNIWDQLKKYANDPNVFIHFADHLKQDYNFVLNGDNSQGTHYSSDHPSVQTKLGINPKYTHTMPMGIYGYNLQQYIKEHGHDASAYGGDRAYIWVFKSIGPNVKDMSTYSKDDWLTDYNKIIQMYPDMKDEIDKYSRKREYKGHIGKLFTTTWMVTQKNPRKQAYLFSQLGYGGFIDNGAGVFSQIEYSQAVFFNKAQIKVLDLIRSQNETISPGSGLSTYELSILHDPEKAYEYAEERGERWIEAEKYIMKSPYHAYLYAINVMGHPWEEAEPYIKQSDYVWERYTEEFGY